MSNLCKHFGVCGGCSLQNLPYEQQLAQKTAKVAALLSPFYGGRLAAVPSPQQKNFRNKIELSFARQPVWADPAGGKKVKRDKTIPLVFESVLGFRYKGRWDRCVDLQECIIFNDKLAQFCAAIRAWAAAKNIDFYDQRTHKGTLRNIILREGKNTGEGMIILVGAQPFDAASLAEAVANIYPNYSVLTAQNPGVSDAAGLTEISTLKGAVVMREGLFTNEGKEIFFELSPGSFFQTNTKAANLMYNRVQSLLSALKPEVMYDLYGGAGSFSLLCAGEIGKSLCVESVQAAVTNGQKNAQINNINNVQFYCAAVEDFLASNKISAHKSVIVLDPPRMGLHPKACEAVAASGVRDILYISCNPASLARDLEKLAPKYNVAGAECYDFFPHTDHIETLLQLKLKA